MEEVPNIDWYRSLDADNLILGFCGTPGGRGVFRFWIGKSRMWQFCPADTKAWDWYHQGVYRMGRAQKITFRDIADKVPPLPAGFPPPDLYHVRDPSDKSLFELLPGGGVVSRLRRTLPGSRLLKKVWAAPQRRLPVYVVLREDIYESALGDGVFRDFESAHLDEDAAKTHIDRLEGRYDYSGFTTTSFDEDGTRHDQPGKTKEIHLRKAHLILSGWTVGLDKEDSDLSRFDRVTKKEIVRDINYSERRTERRGHPR